MNRTEIRTIEEALAWGDAWEAHAKRLRKDLERALIDRNWWMEQSNFWHNELQNIVSLWIAETPKARKSVFDEIDA